MQLKHLTIAVLVGAALAQSQNLNATLAGNNQLSNLTTYLGLYPNLLSQLNNASNITVLAPSNQAFSKLLNSSAGQSLATNSGAIQALLQYHVLNGSYPASTITNSSRFIRTSLTNQTYANVTNGQRVQAVKVGNQTVFYSGLLQNATVSQADVNFTGGVIHIVDSVLSIPISIPNTASAVNLTAFRGALNATNLTNTINAARDLTIFAPNNNAFQGIGSALSNLSTTDLANILSYHVINGTVGYSSTLTNNTSLKTLGGSNITVHISNGTTFVNGAKVITSDLLVENGVIHIIDNVINPNNTSAAPSASATTGAPAFTSASSATNVPFTSGQPTPTTTVNPTTAGAGPAASHAASSSSKAAAVPMQTGAVGAVALFGGAAMLLNY